MRPDFTALKLANVYWLVAAMALVVAPHMPRLPIWIVLPCVAVVGWRVAIARRGMKNPPWWAMLLLAVAATLATYVAHDRLYGRDASATLLIVMLCLKMLEMRSRRDALLTVFLGFFLIFTNFLYSQTVLMGGYMLVCVWLLVATLIGFNRTGAEASLRERLIPSAWMIVQAVPLMLMVFFLFPRLATPLWQLPSDAHGGMTGLSETMAPGDLSKLSISEKVAFRADFKGPIPINSSLYWRGPVLWGFDGRTWRISNGMLFGKAEEHDIETLSRGVDYTVTVEPHGKTWLFALDLPSVIPADTTLTRDYQLRAAQPVNVLKRYDVRSSLSYRAGLTLEDSQRRAALALPKGSNPRAFAFAQKLRADYADDRELIRQTLLLYNREFTYTLEPPLLGRNTVDEFLFDTKKGFCEHYSSSFVFLMRAAGIPARVVMGYQGGEVNPVGNYLIVRQADAHAWAEVWQEGRGWVRVDPTAAVSPDRIENGIDMALGPVGVIPNLVAADKFGVLREIGFAWDTVNNQWNQWVIGYNTDRQQFLLGQWGLDVTDWKRVALWLLGATLLGGGITAAFLLLRLRGKRTDPVVAAYRRFTAKLACGGLVRAAHEGPMDFLARVEAARPDLADAARDVTKLYVELRYAQREYTAAELALLRRLVRMLRPQR